ncbi:hypothetical protein Aperf_G00000041438 [Anoplocephala perfoliata]
MTGLPNLPFYQLVLIRNGESELTRHGIFCGWADSDISYRGECQAEEVGRLLSKKKVEFDIAFTSYLKRAIKTCHIILGQMSLEWIPVQKSWRLNPQMFGMLQGCHQSKLVVQYGDNQVMSWRRDYVSAPPPLSQNSREHPIYENKYTLFTADGRAHKVSIVGIRRYLLLLIPTGQAESGNFRIVIVIVVHLWVSGWLSWVFVCSYRLMMSPMLLDKSLIPDTECLRDSYERLLPFWCDGIVPAIKEGNRVLVVAHESTLRVLMKYVDHISDENIAYANIPPCTPLVYDFDEQMRPIRHYYLMNDGTIQDVIIETKQDPCPEC